MSQASPVNSVASAEPVLFVGIDWADKKHDVHWIHADGRHGKMLIEQSPEQIEQLVAELLELAGGGLVAVALEKSRGPLQHALMFREGLTLYAIDPKQFARYRESFASGGAKSDLRDAALLARMLRERIGELRPLRPDDEATRRVAHLAQTRRELVDEKTRLKLQLQAFLKCYFPLLLTLGDVASPLVLEILRRWPDPREFRRLHPETLTKLLERYRVKAEDRPAQIELIRKTPLLTKDAPLIESLIFRTKAVAGQLQSVLDQIQPLEAAIETAMAAHPDAPLFQAIPGAGDAMAPRLLAAFGSDRDRFDNADEVAIVSGIAPVTIQSGKTKVVVRRRACPQFLKQTFHEFADHARKWCDWSKAYYQYLKKEKKMGHHAALRKLASRWIRILYRVWQDRKPYDPTHYLRRLQETNHPLLRFLEQSTVTP